VVAMLRVNVTINVPYNDSESHGTYGSTCRFRHQLSFTIATRCGEHLQTDRVPGASLNMLTDSYAKVSNGKYQTLLVVLIPVNTR
jgi:hypothetical protein